MNCHRPGCFHDHTGPCKARVHAPVDTALVDGQPVEMHRFRDCACRAPMTREQAFTPDGRPRFDKRRVIVVYNAQDPFNVFREVRW